MQQWQLFSWIVFISRCLFFNLGNGWYITHSVTDLPRDAVNLFPGRDVSGLTQCRHTNDSAGFGAFFPLPFQVFLETGVVKNKSQKSICSSLCFQGRTEWGAAALQMCTYPNPLNGVSKGERCSFTLARQLKPWTRFSSGTFVCSRSSVSQIKLSLCEWQLCL